MIIDISENVSIYREDDPNFMGARSVSPLTGNFFKVPPFRRIFIPKEKIRIKDKWYDVLSLSKVVRSKNPDGYYRFIYIQINRITNEYYVGKVNRRRWSEIKRYQGSGVKFSHKLKHHKKEFTRYFILACSSAKESERIEAEIVDEVLLADEKCLNLVRGGAGTNEHYDWEKRSLRQQEIMKEHPEFYQSMLDVARQNYCSGPTNALEQRSLKIKETMSQDKYREMSRERILKWKEENPEAYAESRKNNKLALKSEETVQKKAESHAKYKTENPEKYQEHMNKCHEAAHTKEAEEKRSASLKAFNANNPEKAKENAKKRAMAAAKANSKTVLMKNAITGEVLRKFESVQAAARWLVEQGIAKNTNCVSSISAVCLKKEVPGHGVRKKAYGYGWGYEI